MTVDFTAAPPSGYVECACCGSVIIGAWLCGGCHPEDRACPGAENCTGEDCDMSVTYHCVTGHCDGSGCTYPSECA